MRKRIISIILTLAIALSVICVGAVSVSAAANTATIKVGSKTYTASVGDYMRYTVSFRYSGGRVYGSDRVAGESQSPQQLFTERDRQIHL